MALRIDIATFRQHQYIGGNAIDLTGQMRLRQHHFGLAVIDDLLNATDRILCIERHIGATGFQDGPQSNHEFMATVEAQTNKRVAADTLLTKNASQAICTSVEFRKGKLFVHEDAGRLVWISSNLTFHLRQRDHHHTHSRVP